MSTLQPLKCKASTALVPTIDEKQKEPKTYNSEDSLVVTHPTTNSPACGLSTAERTGSPVFHTLWSYVLGQVWEIMINCKCFVMQAYDITR